VIREKTNFLTKGEPMEATLLIPDTKQRKTRRRGNGEGSIFQRADSNRWEATITVGYNTQGKRLRRTVYGWTKKEVQDKLTGLQSRKLDGTLGEPSKLTVAKFLERWLEDSARPTIRATTHANYKGVIEKHITPRIGGIGLIKLVPAHVQSLYAEMERNGASAYTRLLAHAVLRRALKQAVKWGIVVRNVCDAVEPPRIARVDIHPLTTEQVGTLFEAAANDRLEALYVLAVGAGMRLGELFGLQWTDVDLKAGAVTVQHTLSELNGTLTLAEPKTAKSRRRIELPDIAVAALLSHRRRMLADGHASSPWVFCNQHGTPLRRSHFHRQEFKPLLKKAELPDIRFHDLRHTSATLLLSQGVHPKVVQERLGHSQISVTMDTYSHVMPGMGREAAGKLNAVMSATPKPAATAAG
jgi:integrase